MAHLSDSRIADALELNVKYDGPNSTLYCHLVGSLIYSTMTRLDVAHVVKFVSYFVSDPHKCLL